MRGLRGCPRSRRVKHVRIATTGRCGQSRFQPLAVSDRELARFDLEAIVPIPSAQTLQEISPGRQPPRLPLFEHVAVLVKHERGVAEEILGAPP